MTFSPIDQPHYAHIPPGYRPRLRWPNNAPLAVTIFLYFEHWELDIPKDAIADSRFRDMNGAFHPDHFTVSMKEYGNRVGIFRILDLLDRHNLKVTVAANSSACAHYPYLVECFQKRGYEFAAHGTHASRMITSKMSSDQEAAHIDAALTGIIQATGEKPKGWVGQDYGESIRTPQFLADRDLLYVADWPSDEQPHRIGQLISIPNQAEWDDVQLLWHRRVSPVRYPEIIRAAAARLHEDGAHSARFFGLHLHPWVAGTPHRIRYVEEALAALAALPNLWRATAGEVAECAALQILG